MKIIVSKEVHSGDYDENIYMMKYNEVAVRKIQRHINSGAK